MPINTPSLGFNKGSRSQRRGSLEVGLIPVNALRHPQCDLPKNSGGMSASSQLIILRNRLHTSHNQNGTRLLFLLRNESPRWRDAQDR